MYDQVVYALEMSWRRLLKSKAKNIFKTSSRRLNQDKCLLGFAIISIDFLFVCNNKYYLQVYLVNFASNVVNNQMIDYLDETDED